MRLHYSLRLTVPFHEKEAAAALGAKPGYKNGKFVCWYIPSGISVLGCVRWWPEEFREAVQQGTLENVAPEELRAAQKAASQTFGAPAPADEGKVGEQAQGTSLSQYLAEVKGVIQASFATSVWVMADIVNLSGRPGSHRYFELAEYDNQGKEVAKSRGMCWSRQATTVLKRFEEATGMALAPGMKALLRVKAQLHERYGLSLQIEDIDPRYTIGEMQAKIQRIRKRLAEEGRRTQLNRVPLPTCFESVALIAPDKAAGLGDFNTQADVLQDIGLCRFEHYPAFFQGDQARDSLVSALRSIGERHRAGARYDAIVMIRGGGDTAGLLALNEYDIVAAICDADIPVIVGIGHERDKTLLDEYAAASFATPSMVVNHISRSWLEYGESVRTIQHRMQQCVGDVLVRVREQLASKRQGISELLRNEHRRVSERLQLTQQTLWRNNIQTLDRLQQTLNAKRHEVAGVSPKRILSLGYAYVVDGPGRTLPTAAALSAREAATLRMRDGDVRIRVAMGGESDE